MQRHWKNSNEELSFFSGRRSGKIELNYGLISLLPLTFNENNEIICLLFIFALHHFYENFFLFPFVLQKTHLYVNFIVEFQSLR